jgi:hypothetical protein
MSFGYKHTTKLQNFPEIIYELNRQADMTCLSGESRILTVINVILWVITPIRLKHPFNAQYLFVNWTNFVAHIADTGQV